MRCGIMDPYAVGFSKPGELLWLDCMDRSVEHVPLDTERVRIAIADSGVRRRLAQGEFNRRVEECARAFEHLQPRVPDARCLRQVPRDVVLEAESELPAPLFRRARHVVEEVERAFAARDALVSGDLEAFGRSMTAAHESLRDLFEVSIPELDALIDEAHGWPGVLGGRLTGAGFGGCVVLMLERDACDGFADFLAQRFEARFGTRPPVEFFRSVGGPREV